MKNKFHYWSKLFHSSMKNFLLKIDPKFVRPTGTSYYNHFWKLFANNPIWRKQKCLLNTGYNLWTFQDTYLSMGHTIKLLVFKCSSKTNKNLTPLLKHNFSWLETLLLGLKRYLHSKGPQNGLCLMGESDKSNNVQSGSFCNQRQMAFIEHLEWRNISRPKSKVSSHEKLFFRSGVRFLFLFVLMDAIF